MYDPSSTTQNHHFSLWSGNPAPPLPNHEEPTNNSQPMSPEVCNRDNTQCSCHICVPLNSSKLWDPDFQLLGLSFITCLFMPLNCVFRISLTIMLFFRLPVLLPDIHLTIPLL